MFGAQLALNDAEWPKHRAKIGTCSRKRLSDFRRKGSRKNTIMHTQRKSEATSSQERVIRNVLEARANGQINDATADFADQFRFKDYYWRGQTVRVTEVCWRGDTDAGPFRAKKMSLVICDGVPVDFDLCSA